ncbi:MAG TPA: ROK family transcriptional regulator [Chloroflexota bacterium]|jgi:predicted NBD/HSP70 family sugar kinase
MIATRTGSKRLLRDLNRSIVLNLIAAHGPISRTDVAREGGLPAATVTHIVGDFVRAGLVTETQSEESSGGRRPVHLTINPAAGHVAGVKLREDGMTVVLCDLACTVVHSREEPLPGGVEPDQAVALIAQAIDRCIEQARVSRVGILGIGVGISGLVDSSRGVCHYSAILGWKDFEIGPALEFVLGLQVRVDNDVNTLAVAERHFGAGRDVADFLLVTVGRGIGLGVVVGGEIYRGAHGGAGEFGHMTVDTSADAPLCNCGKRGCLEAVASDYGILRAAIGEDPGHQVETAMSALVARARADDARIRGIFARAGTALGVALANLVNIFDPALLLIGGEGLRAGDLIIEPMRSALPQHLFGRRGEDIPLSVRQTTEVQWARGAASLMLREVFRPPIYETGEEPVIDTLLASRRIRARKRG